MICTKTVKQINSYTPVADELQSWLEIIQGKWNCKIISVFETKVNKSPNCSDQAFIILYDDKEMTGNA